VTSSFRIGSFVVEKIRSQIPFLAFSSLGFCLGQQQSAQRGISKVESEEAE
jgi:hypothetical protein